MTSLLVAWAALALPAVVAPARAEDPCRGELERLCREAPADQKEKCLENHKGRLSRACARTRPALLEAAEAVPAACQADESSPDCRQAKAAAAARAQAAQASREEARRRLRERDAEARAACAADLDRFCADVKAKPGREASDCIDKHWSEVSSACRAHAWPSRRRKPAKAAP